MRERHPTILQHTSFGELKIGRTRLAQDDALIHKAESILILLCPEQVEGSKGAFIFTIEFKIKSE